MNYEERDCDSLMYTIAQWVELWPVFYSSNVVTCVVVFARQPDAVHSKIVPCVSCSKRVYVMKCKMTKPYAQSNEGYNHDNGGSVYCTTARLGYRPNQISPQ